MGSFIQVAVFPLFSHPKPDENGPGLCFFLRVRHERLRWGKVGWGGAVDVFSACQPNYGVVDTHTEQHCFGTNYHFFFLSVLKKGN